jgi:hypothetical protein
MKRQGNVSLLKSHNASITKYKDTEMVEIPEEKFKSLILKVIGNFKR